MSTVSSIASQTTTVQPFVWELVNDPERRTLLALIQFRNEVEAALDATRTRYNVLLRWNLDRLEAPADPRLAETQRDYAAQSAQLREIEERIARLEGRLT